MVFSKLSFVAAALALSGLGVAQSPSATDSVASKSESPSTEASAATDSITSSNSPSASNAIPTVSLIDMFPGDGSLLGSVLHVGQDATTYSIDCVETKTKGGEEENCGVFTVAQGPEMFNIHGIIANVTSAAQCVVASSTIATCTSSVIKDGETVAPTTMTLTGTQVTYTPVTITDGADELNAGATLSGSRWLIGGAAVMAAAVFAAGF